MSLRILSAAPLLVSLFFFSAFAVAGVNVTAICTSASYSWTFNSVGQSPCVVAAYMLSTCHQGSYTLAPLSGEGRSGYGYEGPGGRDGLAATECECSTIGYSLISACSGCQGLNVFSYDSFVFYCGSSTLPSSQFPNPVPAGIYVPHWAILIITGQDNWSADDSYAAGDSPEYGPGAVFGPSGVYTTSTSASASSTASSTPSHSGSHTLAIAGSVIGGIAIITVAVVAIFYLQRRPSQAASAGIGASQSTLSHGTVAQSSSGSPLTMRFYDPDDPTTFPEYQGDPRSLYISPTSQVPLPSHVGSGSTQADVQTSLPHARGYHGLPMPSV